MAHQLRDIKLDQALPAQLTFLHFQRSGSQTHQQSEYAGSDDPAPPHAPAVAEVDQSMSDEAHQSARHGTINHCQECQQAVLNGDAGIGHGAGNGDKAAQDKEQGSTDADGDNGFHREFFHDFYLHSNFYSGKDAKTAFRSP